MARGAFIVIEGLDRSGKTTQTAKIVERLGENVKLYKFPDRTTETGKMIDSYLKSKAELDDRAIHLLFSANRWEVAEQIVRELESGITVVADRYAFSGIAFSAAKHPALPSASSPSTSLSPIAALASAPLTTLTYDWCKAPDRSLPAPDLVVFLDVSPEIQAERGGYGEERYEKAEMQERVRDVFKRIEAEFQPGMGTTRWVTLDAGGTIDEVAARLWEAVSVYASGAVPAVGKLWST